MTPHEIVKTDIIKKYIKIIAIGMLNMRLFLLPSATCNIIKHTHIPKNSIENTAASNLTNKLNAVTDSINTADKRKIVLILRAHLELSIS